MRLAMTALTVVTVCAWLGACGGGKHASSKPAAVRRSSVSRPGEVGAALLAVPRVGGGLAGDQDDDDVPGGELDDRSEVEAGLDHDYVSKRYESYRDSDDTAFVRWGHAAAPAEVRAVAMLVKRYYSAAVARQGAAACSLMYSLLVEIVPEDYGREAGANAFNGTDCATVMTELFDEIHDQLVTITASLRVTGVRVDGNDGRVFLGAITMPAGYMRLRREDGTWKVRTLVAVALP